MISALVLKGENGREGISRIGSFSTIYVPNKLPTTLETKFEICLQRIDFAIIYSNA